MCVVGRSEAGLKQQAAKYCNTFRFELNEEMGYTAVMDGWMKQHNVKKRERTSGQNYFCFSSSSFAAAGVERVTGRWRNAFLGDGVFCVQFSAVSLHF